MYVCVCIYIYIYMYIANAWGISLMKHILPLLGYCSSIERALYLRAAECEVIN